MLSLAKINEINRLLRDENLSQRKIAKLLGVSRGTVGDIASGKRGLYGREPRAENSQSNEPDLMTPPERCNGCGGLVYKPCMLCMTRAYLKSRMLKSHELKSGSKKTSAAIDTSLSKLA